MESIRDLIKRWKKRFIDILREKKEVMIKNPHKEVRNSETLNEYPSWDDKIILDINFFEPSVKKEKWTQTITVNDTSGVDIDSDFFGMSVVLPLIDFTGRTDTVKWLLSDVSKIDIEKCKKEIDGGYGYGVKITSYLKSNNEPNLIYALPIKHGINIETSEIIARQTAEQELMLDFFCEIIRNRICMKVSKDVPVNIKHKIVEPDYLVWKDSMAWDNGTNNINIYYHPYLKSEPETFKHEKQQYSGYKQFIEYDQKQEASPVKHIIPATVPSVSESKQETAKEVGE